MWKQKLGSNATYQKLINVFETSGYRTYAEIVQNVACSVDGAMESFSDSDHEEPLSQPDTYPHPKPSPPSLPKSSTHAFSNSCDEYMLVSRTALRDLPEGMHLKSN